MLLFFSFTRLPAHTGKEKELEEQKRGVVGKPAPLVDSLPGANFYRSDYFSIRRSQGRVED